MQEVNHIPDAGKLAKCPVCGGKPVERIARKGRFCIHKTASWRCSNEREEI